MSFATVWAIGNDGHSPVFSPGAPKLVAADPAQENTQIAMTTPRLCFQQQLCFTGSPAILKAWLIPAEKRLWKYLMVPFPAPKTSAMSAVIIRIRGCTEIGYSTPYAVRSQTYPPCLHGVFMVISSGIHCRTGGCPSPIPARFCS